MKINASNQIAEHCPKFMKLCPKFVSKTIDHQFTINRPNNYTVIQKKQAQNKIAFFSITFFLLKCVLFTLRCFQL